VDPKRLLESTQDAPSPNVLVQNLLGVARTEAAPEGARRRARRSVDSVFTPRSPEKAPGKEATVEASASESGGLKSVARSASKLSSAKPAPAKPAPPRPAPTKSPPPKSLPAAGAEPCPGCPPFS
jgi:hypothetical protein